MGKHPLSGYGPISSVNRLVRTRMLGGVGTGGEKPPVTRLDGFRQHTAPMAFSIAACFAAAHLITPDPAPFNSTLRLKKQLQPHLSNSQTERF